MKLSLVLSLATLTAVVAAQRITPCLQRCLDQSKQCNINVDLTCPCTNRAFQNSVQHCLDTQCTPADNDAAQQLKRRLCG